MSWLKRWYVWLPFLLLVFAFFYLFSEILIYLVTALVISLMGNPIVRFLDKLRFKKLRLPHSFNALIGLVTVVGILFGIMYFLIPILFQQAQALSDVDVYSILDSVKGPIKDLETDLHDYGILAEEETFDGLLSAYISGLFQNFNVQQFTTSLFGMVGTLSIAVFSILFLSYFFLRDDRLLYKGLKVVTPNHAHDEVARILFYSKKMLSRYFIGLFTEQIIMMIIIATGMYIIGLPNAIFIAFIAGLFNVIPYLGPLIGGSFGILIGLATLSPEVFADESGTLVLKMALVFISAKLIDDFVLQPVIYSRSVKAHPIEIFLIVLMAGTLAGPIGMILAIPVYTLLRIIAMEFFSNWSLIQNLTQNLGNELQRTREGKDKTDE